MPEKLNDALSYQDAAYDNWYAINCILKM